MNIHLLCNLKLREVLLGHPFELLRRFGSGLLHNNTCISIIIYALYRARLDNLDCALREMSPRSILLRDCALGVLLKRGPTFII